MLENHWNHSGQCLDLHLEDETTHANHEMQKDRCESLRATSDKKISYASTMLYVTEHVKIQIVCRQRKMYKINKDHDCIAGRMDDNCTYVI